MTLAGALTTALLTGRRAHTQGTAAGRDARTTAIANAERAEQEQESVLAKALIERERSDRDGERLRLDRARSDRDQEKSEWEQGQRPLATALTQSLIDRNRASAAASRRSASRPAAGGTAPKPLTVAGARSARNELAMDAVRSQAVREGVDISTLKGVELGDLARRAVQRIRIQPGMQARAAAAGATMDDYFSAAQALQRGGDAGPADEQARQFLVESLAELDRRRRR